MPFNEWWAPLQSLQGAASAVSNTTSQTSLLNGQAKYTIPAQFWKYIGNTWTIRASGIMSTAGSSPGTFNFTVVLGAINVYSGGASPTLATSASSAPWHLQLDLTVRTVGSSTAATVAGGGLFCSTALSATTPIQILASPGGLTGFDTTVASLLDLQGTWSVASSSNTITCNQFVLSA